MLKLKELTLTNFLSHESSVIKFKDNQKLLIDGKSGMGKSAIIEALVWVLYNQGRVDNRSIIQRKKKMARVDLLLEDNKYFYKIERIITEKGKHDLVVLEGNNLKTLVPIKANGTRAIQEYLEEKILHSSYLLFINSIVYPQDNVESFVKQTAARKKEIILEMINASNYDEYYEKVKTKITSLKNEIDVSTGMLENFNMQIKDDSEKAKKLKTYKKLQKQFDDELKKIEKERDKANKLWQVKQEAIVKVDIKTTEIQKIKRNILDHQGVIKESEIKLDEIEKSDIRINDLKNDIKDTEIVKNELRELELKKTATNNWQAKMIEALSLRPVDRNFDVEIDGVNQLLMQVMGKKFEICPEIQKECSILTKNRDIETKRLENELNEKTVDKQKYDSELKIYNERVINLGDKPIVDEVRITELNRIITESVTIEKKIVEIEQNKKFWQETAQKSIDSSVVAINSLEIELSAAETELLGINVVLADKDALETSLQGINSQISSITEASKSNSSALTIATVASENINKIKVKIDELNNKDKDTKISIENLQLLKDAFSQNGIKAILIDYVIPKLEDRINEILGKLSDFRVKLDTQKSGVKEDTVIEGLFINIFNEMGEQYDFDSFSGGEKVKISAAIFEALAEIQNFDFRILDESIISLDEDSTEKFVEVMESLQQRVNQIICITHLRQVSDLFIEKLHVKKINGISKIMEV